MLRFGLWSALLQAPHHIYVLVVENPDALLRRHTRWFSKRALAEHGLRSSRNSVIFRSIQSVSQEVLFRQSVRTTVTHKPVFCQGLNSVLACSFPCEGADVNQVSSYTAEKSRHVYT